MKPDDDILDVVAAAGPTAASALQVRVSASEARREGQGLSGRAIRSQQACIVNDYLADSSVKAFHNRARSDGANSGGAFPLFVQGRVVGIMIFISFFEREVMVIADRGISKVVEQKEWDKMVQGIIQNIRMGKVVDGIEAAILRCGEILLEKGFLKTADDVNELKDDLRIE